MAPPPQVIQWLDENFPKPRVDPEWLEGCTEWLEGDQNISPVTAFPEFMERVKWQLLESDLLDSMLPGTGLDAHVSTLSGRLGGPPVLVQINTITEIGASAFQLDQIRAAREERMLAGVGDEEGEEDGDVEVEGEGPMPKYPRNALRFQLTDGATSIEAMEHRRIPQLILGNTPLGYKMQLKGTRFQNGMAMLEPATITLLGGKQAELEANQLKDFKGALYERLGRPLTPIPNDEGPVEENRDNAPAAATARSPLRDISPPPMPAFPQHDDDVDMEPRRRLPTNSSLNDVPDPSNNDTKRSRPIKTLPSRQNRTSTGGVSDTSEDAQVQRRISMAERATLVFAGSQTTRSTTSTYFNVNATASGSGSTRLPSREINIAMDELDFNFEPTGRQLSRTLPSPEPVQSYEPDIGNDPFDFDFLDEMDQENQPPPPLQDKGKARQVAPSATSATQPPISITVHDDSSDEYGMDDSNDFDPAFLEECAKIERNAILKNSVAHPSSSSSVPMSGSGSGASSSVSSVLKSSVSQKGHVSLPTNTATRVADVIEIDDSDDEMLEPEDKENEPVATRHVRRRTDAASAATTAGPSRTAPSQSQNHRSQNTRKKTGQPVVLATNPDDIINLSDSD